MEQEVFVSSPNGERWSVSRSELTSLEWDLVGTTGGFVQALFAYIALSRGPSASIDHRSPQLLRVEILLLGNEHTFHELAHEARNRICTGEDSLDVADLETE